MKRYPRSAPKLATSVGRFAFYGHILAIFSTRIFGRSLQMAAPTA